MKNRFLILLLPFLLCLFYPLTTAMAAVVDRIVAVVGSEVIFSSELDSREKMTRLQYPDLKNDQGLRGSILDGLINQKIILTKARLDSVAINENEVSALADDRLRQLSRRFASKDAMEGQFGKSLEGIRRDLADELRSQQMSDKLRRKKFVGVTIGYDEAMSFYRNNRGAMPTIPEEVSVSQILKFPGVTRAVKADARKKIEDIEKKYTKGFMSFPELARKYSSDPGSAQLGGDLGFVQRGELVKPFEDAAYGLKDGKVSGIVETRYGFHLIQRLGREGRSIHVRHILVAFDRSDGDEAEAVALLDAIRSGVLSGKGSFAAMAGKYSDDPVSASLGGAVLASGSSRPYLDPRSLRPQLQKIIGGLKGDGDISRPEKIIPPQGEPFYGIFRLNHRRLPHTLNPEKDYAQLEQLALDDKKQRLFSEWVSELRREVYVRRSDI
ncbi:MAG: peptidylprolyl isomerase [Candidatus Chlorobium antarcticum]|nr:peptidylprolyl isomerase [Candidatus Chlorobium antarcticum]